MKSWATLADRSIAQYENIVNGSGTQFFEESGLLIFGVRDAFIQQTQDVAAKMHTPLVHLDPVDISKRFPWMGVPTVTELGLLQEQNAGHMSPRKLTTAQLKLATDQGASYIDSVVENVSEPENGSTYVVTLSNGQQVETKNVLVAAGCYTSLLPLLPEQVAVSLTGAQALLVEVSHEDALSLKGMPALIYEGEKDEDCYYLLPPIQYPDGAWLIKIGPSTSYAPPLKSVSECNDWFKRGHVDKEFELAAQAFFQSLFPRVTPIRWRSLLCVTDNTPTQNAYIDLLKPGWGICTGGNGWAAKSSDAIGNLAAQMMFLPQHWTPDPTFPKTWFRAVTPKELKPTPQLETAIARVEACGHIMAHRVVEALSIVTAVLASRPFLRRRPAQLAGEVRAELCQCWTTEEDGSGVPSVFCAASASTAWAPSQPYIVVRAGTLDVIVVASA
eukprot:TRINITY_DN64141_c0_g1_i1.p1 TRINITY_DN64141_c0_g1~~TRINITY_DN64141_c0_g1_i1.p1  ORF type:complete len:515 (+),score=69.89 TRINITY_DN64141_c0_g1_i1:216-1547(+)